MNTAIQISSRIAHSLSVLMAEPLRFVADPTFNSPDARRRIFDRAVTLPEPPEVRYRQIAEDSTNDRKRRGEARSTLTIDEERLVFQRYNYARYRAARAQKLVQRLGPAPKLARELIRWHRLAIRWRNRAVRYNLRLVLTVIGRIGCRKVDIADLISEGNVALMRAVENYDPSRGLKFSTYAWKAILNSLRRCHAVDGRRRRMAIGFDESIPAEASQVEPRERHEQDCCTEVCRIVTENRAALTTLEAAVIKLRFGFGGDTEMTLDQVSQAVGRTRERVRQIQFSAMEKIRHCLDTHYLSRPTLEPAPDSRLCA